MKQVADTLLLDRIKGDDNAAFYLLFQKYYQLLFLFACKFLNENIAQDIVQDCFHELWKKRKKIDINTSLSAWLFQVVRYKCYRHFKDQKQQLEGKSTYSLLMKEEEINYYMFSEKSIVEFDLNDRIQKIIMQLPSKCAQVFNDSRFKGLRNKEIAEKYNISEKAVEKHISYALRIFREQLQDLLVMVLPVLIDIALF